MQGHKWFASTVIEKVGCVREQTLASVPQVARLDLPGRQSLEPINSDGSLAQVPRFSFRACHIGKHAVKSLLLGNT